MQDLKLPYSTLYEITYWYQTNALHSVRHKVLVKSLVTYPLSFAAKVRMFKINFPA